MDVAVRAGTDKGVIECGELPEDANVLALVTCSYQTSNSRTVVYAVETGSGR